MLTRILPAVVLTLSGVLLAAGRAVPAPAMLPPPPPAPRMAMQQAVVIGPTDAIGFDYANADFQAYTVSRFEAQWDGASTWSTIPTSGGVVLSDTPTGYTTYKVVPPFSSGTHNVVFRACSDAAGCGGSSPAPPFAFAYPSVSPPVPPGNVRKVPR